MHITLGLEALARYFDASKPTEHGMTMLAGLLAEEKMTAPEMDKAVRESLKSDEFFPKCGKLLKYARPTTKGGRAHQESKWLPGERPIDPEWYERASPAERRRASERSESFEPVEVGQALESGILDASGKPGFPNAIYWQAKDAAGDRMNERLLGNIWGGLAVRSNHPNSLWPSELDHVPVGKRYDPESKGWR